MFGQLFVVVTDCHVDFIFSTSSIPKP